MKFQYFEISMYEGSVMEHQTVEIDGVGTPSTKDEIKPILNNFIDEENEEEKQEIIDSMVDGGKFQHKEGCFRIHTDETLYILSWKFQ